MRTRILLVHGNEEALLFDGEMPITPRTGELLHFSAPPLGSDLRYPSGLFRVHQIAWAIVPILPKPDDAEPELAAGVSLFVHGFYEAKATETAKAIERPLFPS